MPPPAFVGGSGEGAVEEATGKVVTLIRQIRPHVVVTHDETGGYYHPDHIHCWKITTAAFEAAQSDPDVAGFGAVGANGVPMPNIPEMGGVWNDWGIAETEIVDQKTTDPAGTWDAMVSKLQAELG